MADSITLSMYKDRIIDIMQLYYPMSREELSPIVDYSINKRYKEFNAEIDNNYTHSKYDVNLLQLADYINSKQPIVTSFGTMFSKHATVPNPLATVVQQFLDARSIHKKQMFKYPKGSEDFEKYNLLQSLDKIDCNGIYGCLGQFSALVFNTNVATSITAQGRTSTSNMTMLFESFLANSVKFGSIDEVLLFISNVKNERRERKYDYRQFVDQYITVNDCFAKLILSCGWRWVPSEQEMEVIYHVVQNLGYEDLVRVYYKNNLYEFMSNTPMKDRLVNLMETLEEPYLNPLDCPEEIKTDIEEFADIIKEFVYYGYMYIDRIDRTMNMIKDVTMISDTDSTIISLDAWFRFGLETVKDVPLKIKKYQLPSVVSFLEKDEFGDFTKESKKKMAPFEFVDSDYDYDFADDKLIEMRHAVSPFTVYPEDNVRYSLINIMAYVLDVLVNDYMERYTKSNFSYNKENHKCRIIAKNEFTFKRVLMTQVKKNYASIQEVQEGNIVPKAKQLDIKGIASMAKSSMAESTRDALKEILLEDILNATKIDQFRIIKHIAVLEKKITDSIYNGSKEFYKPLTIKSQNTYENPMRIQGIKASVVWNSIKPDDDGLPKINLEERNAIDVAKISCNKVSVEKLKDKFPEVYEKAVKLMAEPEFKGSITSIAIPLDVQVPEWVTEIIDYKSIINDNISGFVFPSVGIKMTDKKAVNYTNIVQL